MKLSTRITASAATLVLAASFAQAPAQAGPQSPDIPDVIVAGPDGDQKAWFPDVVKLQDGRLVTVFYQATQHSRDDGRYMWTESTDDGKTWSTPRVLIDTPEDDRDAQITQLRDGTIIINWFRTDWSQEHTTGAVILGTFVTRSTDGGETWSDPVQVESSMSCGCGPKQGAYQLGWAATTGKIAELPNGDLLVPLYGTLPDTTVGQASVVRSSDGGLTWPLENEAMIPVPPGVSLSELSLAVGGDGEVTGLLRTAGNSSGGGASHATDSYDGGRTWTMPVITTMKGQAHHILELPGGRLLATYGDRSGTFDSVEPTVGRLRMPGGTWEDFDSVLLFRAGRTVDQSDPSTAVLRGGHLFTVSYDSARGSIIGSFSHFRDYVKARSETPRVLAPDESRILDLPSMLAEGAVSYETTLTSTHRDHPTAQPGGALDGVARYWHSSLGAKATPDNPQQFTLTFKEQTTLRWIGLNQKPGYSQSARIYVSADGVTWNEPIEERVERSVEDVIAWSNFKPMKVKALKVEIIQSAGASMLAELMVAS